MATLSDRIDFLEREIRRLEEKMDTYVNAEERQDRAQRQQDVETLLTWRQQAIDEFQEVHDALDPIAARLLIVSSLPASAPFGAIIRLQGNGNLYLGNGTGQPLTRLIPVAL